MFIISIDPGIVNVGYHACNFDFDTLECELVACACLQIVETIKGLSYQQKETAILNWIIQNDELFRRADVILVESQMKDIFIAFVALLRGRYDHKVKIIHPKTSLNFIKYKTFKSLTKVPTIQVRKKKQGTTSDRWAKNKVDSRELYEEFFISHGIEPNHNSADAVKMCDYYLSSELNVPDENLFINKCIAL